MFVEAVVQKPLNHWGKPRGETRRAIVTDEKAADNPVAQVDRTFSFAYSWMLVGPANKAAFPGTHLQQGGAAL
jgi:hypothetical protein